MLDKWDLEGWKNQKGAFCGETSRPEYTSVLLPTGMGATHPRDRITICTLSYRLWNVAKFAAAPVLPALENLHTRRGYISLPPLEFSRFAHASIANIISFFFFCRGPLINRNGSVER